MRRLILFGALLLLCSVANARPSALFYLTDNPEIWNLLPDIH